MDELSIYFVTWNVATRHPEEDVGKLLNIDHDNSTMLPDFYFIGLQEVKSQPQNIVMDMFFEDPWTKTFKDFLRYRDYVKIRTQRLQGLVLNAFCLRKHITHLRMMEAQYTKTGFGGMWGNKGAVSIRLNIYGVNLCVVNTHLTPHDHLLADRISDYNTILREHTFTAPDTTNILYHDYVFWIGDLNFRLTIDEATAADVNQLIRENHLNQLLLKDQLKCVMASGEAFAELNENTITFPPTYKFEFSSQQYDLKRKPSWTDRILYKVNIDCYEDVKLRASQNSYKSHPNYVQSDHKPVTGDFNIVVRSEIPSCGVEFLPISTWYIDEENSISYKLKGDIKPISGDWVGVFPNGFSSLDEYLVYEYVGREKTSSTSTEQQSATEKIYFSCTALRAPGMFCLVYVAQRGDLVGILGISTPFPAQRRPI